MRPVGIDLETCRRSTCGECGEPCDWRYGGMDGSNRWYHTNTGRAYCYRNPEHKEMAWPVYNEPVGTIESGIIRSETQTVLGFIAECETCPQKAILQAQPDASWICPRCLEANPDLAPEPESDPVRLAHSLISEANQVFRRVVQVSDDDGEWPIGKVQG
jgi:hypothetical protein